jgi:hypothetical protein
MRLLTLIAALSLTTLALSATCETAQAQEQMYTFRVKSNYKYIVQIAFFSQDRPRFEWPGGGKAWNLDDSKVHDFHLRCLGGEKICYGAWVDGNAKLYWGAGIDGKAGCKRCCHVCTAGGQSEILDLDD